MVGRQDGDAKVLDGGGKSDGSQSEPSKMLFRIPTPLFYGTLTPSGATRVIRKRRRRFAAKRHVVTVVPFFARPAQSKISRDDDGSSLLTSRGKELGSDLNIQHLHKFSLRFAIPLVSPSPASTGRRSARASPGTIT